MTMEEREAFKLLTLASARDGRTVSRSTAQVWATDLAKIDFDEAAEALSLHYSETSDWLLPVHVVRCVARIHTQRRLEETHRLTIAERTRRAETEERERLLELGVLIGD